MNQNHYRNRDVVEIHSNQYDGPSDTNRDHAAAGFQPVQHHYYIQPIYIVQPPSLPMYPMPVSPGTMQQHGERQFPSSYTNEPSEVYQPFPQHGAHTRRTQTNYNFSRKQKPSVDPTHQAKLVRRGIAEETLAMLRRGNYTLPTGMLINIEPAVKEAIDNTVCFQPTHSFVEIGVRKYDQMLVEVSYRPPLSLL